MSDQLNVTIDCPPWQPASNVTLLEVLDRYDTPTLVLLNQGSVYYVGQALMGSFGRRAMWVYAPAGSSDVTRLLATTGPAEVDEVVDSLMYGWVLGALVLDDRIAFAHNLQLSGGLPRIEILTQVTTDVTDALTALVGEMESANAFAHQF